MLHAPEALPQVAVMRKPRDAGEVVHAVARGVTCGLTVDQKMRGVVVKALHPCAFGGRMAGCFPFVGGGRMLHDTSNRASRKERQCDDLAPAFLLPSGANDKLADCGRVRPHSGFCWGFMAVNRLTVRCLITVLA